MVDKIQMVGCAFLPIDKEKRKILISKRSMTKKILSGLLGSNRWESRIWRGFQGLHNSRSKRRNKLQNKRLTALAFKSNVFK